MRREESSADQPETAPRFFGVWGLTAPAYPFTRLSGVYGFDRNHIALLSSDREKNGRFTIACNPDHLWISFEIGDAIFSGRDRASVRAGLDGFVFTPATGAPSSGREVKAYVEEDMIKAPARRDLLDMLAASDAVPLTIAFRGLTRTYDLRTTGARDAIAALERSCGYIHDI